MQPLDYVNPFKQNERVLIPAGTLVKSYNPSRREYITKREQRVTVRIVSPGQVCSAEMLDIRDREELDLSELDALIAAENEAWKKHNDYRELSGGEVNPELKMEWHRLSTLRHEFRLRTKDATISWAGTGGYWCDVPAHVAVKLT